MFKFLKDLKSLKEEVKMLKDLLGYSYNHIGTLYGCGVNVRQLKEIEKLKKEIELLHQYLNVQVVERESKIKSKTVNKETKTIKLEKIKK